MDSLILASKTSNLTQGMFIGSVSSNFGERIDQKIFHAEIVVDTVNISAEMKSYQPIPMIVNLRKNGTDNLSDTIEANYKRIKQEPLYIVNSEIERIKSNPPLVYLIED